MPELSTLIGENLEEVEALDPTELIEGELEALRKEKKKLGKIPVFYGGKRTIEVATIEDSEKKAINKCVTEYAEGLRRVSENLARVVTSQRHLVLLFARVAKAVFPETKNYTHPSEEGTLGVLPLIPAAIKYYASPEPDHPAYTSYKTNLWEIDTTKETPEYFFGNGSDYYKASPETEKHSFILLLKDGVTEVGTTPAIDQFRFYTKAYAKYGITAQHPLLEIPLEDGKMLYQYGTLAALGIDHVTENMFGFMPHTTATHLLKLLGFVFFEHSFMPELTTR